MDNYSLFMVLWGFCMLLWAVFISAGLILDKLWPRAVSIIFAAAAFIFAMLAAVLSNK